MSNTPPPHDPTAEAALVSAIMLGHVESSTVADHCKPTDCYLPSTRAVFAAALAVEAAGGKVDSTSIATRLRQANELDGVGGVPGLLAMTYDAPSVAEPLAYAVTIAQLAQRRRVINWAYSVVATSATDTGDHKAWLGELESGFSAATQATEAEEAIIEPAPLLAELQADAMALEAGQSIAIATTGIAELDRSLGGGLCPGRVYIVGARPRVGKTALAMGMALATAIRKERTVVVFSLEMTAKELVGRLATLAVPGVTHDEIMPRFKGGQHVFRNIAAATVTLSNRGLFLVDKPAIKPSRVRSLARRAFAMGEARGFPRGLVVIDYLQLMGSDVKTSDRVDEIRRQSAAIKELAKDLRVPIVLLSQLNRESDGRGVKSHVPILRDLRGSGDIEQDADCILFPHRPALYDDERQGEAVQDDAQVIIAKNRHGAEGTIQLTWQGERMQFCDKQGEFEKELDDLFDLDHG